MEYGRRRSISCFVDIMRELTEGERERIINAVIEGKNGEYWTYLKKQVEEWQRQEIKYLDEFKQSGLGDRDVYNYNRAIDRLEYLNKFLGINETLINFNRNILDRIKTGFQEAYKNVETFLKAI